MDCALGGAGLIVVSPPFIALADVEKRFDDRRTGRTTQALAGLSLTVDEGEFVCLLGPSGCGKSTVLDLLAGFERPTQGRVTIGGQPVGRPDPDRGMVFQDATLFPWLSVLDNITFAPRLAGRPAADYRARAQELIDVMGLRGFERHAVYELSGGMRQRVAIARAWISQPLLLLMDEPFGALDAQTRLDMQELLLAARDRNRATVLFVTHDVEEALLLADRIAIMSHRPGRIVSELVVPYPRPRTYEEIIGTQQFGELKRSIVAMLRREAPTAAALPPADHGRV
ncbi:ABC transporter ATP-binding protein [Bradyrhizobium sp. U87765 SZCCT0131]|uniref:ABC transporter ATP-binding protein n=1 Tax=unclassified Bradyrhizobium TaxID=2631580 RepID=UPI001BA988FF|nr:MULTISPECIES: ABC transporter ATP-binding protein [unclassified Bradyrhizobium]MBR1221845.1 ABC transporter ATP-binding protein [Bradyrhizobium sp. U87765 SZCCT0131]MBR1263957.1 ABC transporter ATP-binding protein [Bradyrhizobium sp. U87765 SZCCT0134]MBR1308260.1 ABC transporter ATP-binding protein [Bradyrhizobium sp. U87765 SZCCT0110]MBR1320207.1 ABC transporter ATP-binding protein [Bradyrhizobium sp. U87765 SZCCT0109]MBR1348680.1 ABC transporter ATP-binding protein [Bradyrhizobium sp. U87